MRRSSCNGWPTRWRSGLWCTGFSARSFGRRAFRSSSWLRWRFGRRCIHWPCHWPRRWMLIGSRRRLAGVSTWSTQIHVNRGVLLDRHDFYRGDVPMTLGFEAIRTGREIDRLRLRAVEPPVRLAVHEQHCILHVAEDAYRNSFVVREILVRRRQRIL
jgi:hypothetical protein